MSLVGFAVVALGVRAKACAADPSFVGALAIAVEDGVASRLGLSEEVKAKLIELINRREDEALEIVLANKDLPPSEQTARLVPFVAESERQGFALLTVAQREKLQQIRLARQGMSSLSEPALVESLGLSTEQRATVKQLLADRAAEMTKGGENERRITRAIYERKLAGVLTDQQRAGWQKMAGLTDTDLAVAQADAPPTTEPAQAATPSEETQPAPKATEASAPAETATPAVGAAATEQPAAGGADESPKEGEATPKESTAEQPATAEGAAPTEEAKPAATEPAEMEQQPSGKQPSTVGQKVPTEKEAKPQAVAGGEPAAKTLPKELRFNFEAAPWKDVLKWFADTAGLSWDPSVVPLGTFSYWDDRVYTVEEAIDLLNSYLLTKGYTLIRHDRMLMVLDYESEIPPELVTLVTVEELDKRGKYEYVKCLFNLAKMSAEDAADMVDPFLAPHGKVIPFPGSRQILVVETAGKLRAIRDMIARVEESAETVIEVELKNISAEEFLTVARRLLGLGEGEFTSEEISISVAVDGKTMYATGNTDKLELLRSLVPLLDKKAEVADEGEEPETLVLRSYPIKAADPQLVSRVLGTMLANMPGVRLEVDPTNNNVVALAYPEDHRKIEETLELLEGQTKQFEVIQVQQLDPELAVAAINKFFGLVGGEEGEKKEGEVTRADAPVVDGDPTTMQIWVRGTAGQIEQIKDLVKKLEEPLLAKRSGGKVRIIPLTGAAAVSAVENVQLLWNRENKIRLVTPSALTPSNIRLRTVTPLEEGSGNSPAESGGNPSLGPLFEGPATPVPQAKPSAPGGPPARDAGRAAQTPNEPATKEAPVDKSASRQIGGVRFQFVSEPPPAEPAKAEQPEQPKGAPAKPSAPEIRVAITPGGIFIASDDLEALDEFEERLRAVSGPAATVPQRNITVFYLKYAKAEVANQLLQDILGGHVDESTSSLLGDVTTNLLGGGLLGGLLGGLAGGGGGGSEDVSTLQATGTVSIVPDPRLNALVVEANPTDLKLIEDLLKVIDRESSETEIETAGVPRPIPIQYASADEVATVVRDVFADRIATTNRGQQRPSPEDFIRALRGQRGGSNRQSRGEEQKMTIGVDLRTNALIVVAPEPLFRQVEALVKLVDMPGLPDQDYVEVVPVNNAEVIAETLEKVIAEKTATGQRTSSSGQPGAAQPSGPTPEQIRQRIEFFQRLRQSGAFGRPGGGPPGGGPPGGFRGFGGGRPGGGAPSGRGGPSGRRGR